ADGLNHDEADLPAGGMPKRKQDQRPRSGEMRASDGTQNVKWKPDIKGAWVTWAAIGFGQMIYVLYVPNHTSPIGFVWGHGDETRCFEVYGSFVEPWARRNGVRTRINQTIFEHADVIVT